MQRKKEPHPTSATPQDGRGFCLWLYDSIVLV
jgi:hypothetical protein